MPNSITLSAVLILSFVLAGCASHGPVLYPNAHLNTVGDAQAQRDIAECQQLADAYVKSNPSGDIAKSTVIGGAGGALVGAAVGRSHRQFWTDRGCLGSRRSCHRPVLRRNKRVTANPCFPGICGPLFTRERVRANRLAVDSNYSNSHSNVRPNLRLGTPVGMMPYQPPSTLSLSVLRNHDIGSTRYSSASLSDR